MGRNDIGHFPSASHQYKKCTPRIQPVWYQFPLGIFHSLMPFDPYLSSTTRCPSALYQYSASIQPVLSKGAKHISGVLALYQYPFSTFRIYKIFPAIRTQNILFIAHGGKTGAFGLRKKRDVLKGYGRCGRETADGHSDSTVLY